MSWLNHFAIILNKFLQIKKSAIIVRFCFLKMKDPGSLEAFKEDPVCKEFLADSEAMKAVDNTSPITSIDPAKFDVVFCVGGHGPMFDLPQNDAVNKAVATVYEKGGIAAAVCHGPAGR